MTVRKSSLRKRSPPAQDLKSAEGTVLLKYDGSVKTIVDKYINTGDGAELTGVPVDFADTDKPDLVMATNAEFPPYEYIDGNMYYGIDVEVAKIIDMELFS